MVQISGASWMNGGAYFIIFAAIFMVGMLSAEAVQEGKAEEVLKAVIGNRFMGKSQRLQVLRCDMGSFYGSLGRAGTNMSHGVYWFALY